MRFIALAIGVAVTMGVGEMVGEAFGEVVEPWWNNAVYYRMLVDSFKDGDGDGLGDLIGATKQVSYVRAVGADAVILSALSARSTDCTQPGTVDFSQIDSRYGNMDMLTNFLNKAHKLELQVVITLQFEAISIASEWFKLSAERKSGYEDIIHWKEAKQGEMATDTGMEWTWSKERKAYYRVKNNEALLNLCSENTAAALSEVQCNWLKSGIDGVMLKIPYTEDFNCSIKMNRILYADALACARSANLKTPVIISETTVELASGIYGVDGANGVICNTLTAPTKPTAPDLAVAIHAATLYSPQDTAVTWQTSTSGGTRIMSRYGSDMIDAINMLALILPGSAVIQQGDELGAADTLLEWTTNSNCWPLVGKGSFAPFPWDDTPGGGFTSGQPWLPLAPNYRYANAKTEFANDLSHVGVVRVAAAMRKSPANGPHTEIKRLGGAIAVLKWGGAGSLLLLINLSHEQTDVQLSKIPGLPPTMTVAVSSGGSTFSNGFHVTKDRGARLGPGEAVLLAGPPRHCSGPGPVDKIANKLSEGWQKINKYFSTI
ncbi:maltase 1-like [Battus philenor]|uniref:maltase 1-like n=1 Tax=Battus philenor TaxID=42288 RepID=UPI0035D10744